jgi:hypothetical protein
MVRAVKSGYEYRVARRKLKRRHHLGAIEPDDQRQKFMRTMKKSPSPLPVEQGFLVRYRGQKTDDRGRSTDVRGWKLEVGMWNAE